MNTNIHFVHYTIKTKYHDQPIARFAAGGEAYCASHRIAEIPYQTHIHTHFHMYEYETARTYAHTRTVPLIHPMVRACDEETFSRSRNAMTATDSNRQKTPTTSGDDADGPRLYLRHVNRTQTDKDTSKSLSQLFIHYRLWGYNHKSLRLDQPGLGSVI